MDFNLRAVFSADTSNLKKGFGQVMTSLGAMKDGAKLSSAGVTDMLKGAGAGVSNVGKALSLGVTVPLVGIGAAAVKTRAGFESQMNRVGAIAGATEEEMKSLEKQALDLGASSIFSAKEVASAQEQLASAGFTTNQILAAAPGLIDMAAVSGGDMELAAEAASSAVRQFGLDINKTGHVADVYAKTAADTNAETADMAEAMKYAGPIAGALGVEFEQTAAAIGIMSNAGIKGSQAGTALRGALTRLSNPTKEAAETMKALKINAFDAQGKMKSLSQFIPELQSAMAGLTKEQKTAALATIFGQNALSGMMALVESSPEELGALAGSLEQCDGAAKNMADRINSGMPGAIEELHGAVETAAIKIANAGEGPLTDFIGKITDLINKFNSLSPEMQQNIVKWVGIAAVAGPLIMIFGKLVQGLAPIGGLVMTMGKHLGGAASGLSSIGKGATQAGGAAAMSAPQILAMGAAFVGFGAGVALAAIGLKMLAESAAGLASAGPLAIAVMVGMVATLALLAKGATMIGPQLSAGAVGFIAFGAGLALAAVGFNLLSDAAIKLNAAGPGAIATLAGITVGLAGFMVLASVIGPGLTAGAVGFIAFGAGLTLIGVAANLGAEALKKISEVLPTVIEHGASGAVSIAALGASMVVFSVGAAVAGVASLALAAGIAALAIALAAAGAAALVAGAGTAIIAATLPIIAASGMRAAAAIVALSGAIVPMSVASVALSSTLLALVATVAAAALGFGAYAAAVGLAAAGTGLLVAGLIAAKASLTAILATANSTASSLQTMVQSIDVVKSGLDGIKSAGKSALDGLISLFDSTAAKATSSGQMAGTNYSAGLSAGLSRAQAEAGAKLSSISAAFTSSGNKIAGISASSGEKAAQSWSSSMSSISSQTISSLNSVVSATTQGMTQFSQRITTGTRQAVTGLRSGLAQAVSSANAYRAEFTSAGYNLSMGMASGIYSGQSAVINAAADVAASAVYAAQRRLQIHSPSKVMANEVGRYVPEGIAEGIIGKKSVVKSAMSSVSELMSRTGVPDVHVGTMLGHSYGYGQDGASLSENNMSRRPLQLVVQMGSHAWELFVDDITKSQDGKTQAHARYLGQGL